MGKVSPWLSLQMAVMIITMCNTSRSGAPEGCLLILSRLRLKCTLNSRVTVCIVCSGEGRE